MKLILEMEKMERDFEDYGTSHPLIEAKVSKSFVVELYKL